MSAIASCTHSLVVATSAHAFACAPSDSYRALARGWWRVLAPNAVASALVLDSRVMHQAFACSEPGHGGLAATSAISSKGKPLSDPKCARSATRTTDETSDCSAIKRRRTHASRNLHPDTPPSSLPSVGSSRWTAKPPHQQLRVGTLTCTVVRYSKTPQ